MTQFWYSVKKNRHFGFRKMAAPPIGLGMRVAARSSPPLAPRRASLWTRTWFRSGRHPRRRRASPSICSMKTSPLCLSFGLLSKNLRNRPSEWPKRRNGGKSPCPSPRPSPRTRGEGDRALPHPPRVRRGRPSGESDCRGLARGDAELALRIVAGELKAVRG
jgi:hypothetical protein